MLEIVITILGLLWIFGVLSPNIVGYIAGPLIFFAIVSLLVTLWESSKPSGGLTTRPPVK